MIDNLEKKGYINIKRCPCDGRAYRIELTQNANQYFEENFQKASKERTKIFKRLSNDQLQYIYNQTNKIVEVLDNYNEND